MPVACPKVPLRALPPQLTALSNTDTLSRHPPERGQGLPEVTPMRLPGQPEKGAASRGHHSSRGRLRGLLSLMSPGPRGFQRHRCPRPGRAARGAAGSAPGRKARPGRGGSLGFPDRGSRSVYALSRRLCANKQWAWRPHLLGPRRQGKGPRAWASGLSQAAWSLPQRMKHQSQGKGVNVDRGWDFAGPDLLPPDWKD